MEATLLLPSEFVVRPNFTTLAAVPCYRRRTSPSRVFAVLTSQPANRLVLEKVLVADPAEDHVRNSKSEAVVDNTLSRTVNHDSWFDLLATNHLSRSVQAAVGSPFFPSPLSSFLLLFSSYDAILTSYEYYLDEKRVKRNRHANFLAGIRNEKRGYESLVEAARAVYKNFNPIQQRELVILALQKAFPSTVLNLIRTVLPNSGLAREFFAAFTTVFFAWLVGPCEVKESEFNGKKERNVVHIKKCRFLEESNCVGMCLNLCKVPSQTFIKDSLGMPVDMVPNFDDMSCEMVFGKEPLKLKDDPAFKKPCYKLCMYSRHPLDICSLKQENQQLQLYEPIFLL
ncbi:hypothetical protein CDL15_Pgr023733 [Punica granatum]|uniref:Beta-carotene isomerase D27-like C-terminal domain-containing protein n=1 Tax=Punica granatum TaxID=22663 RepID=A0A218WTB5_PUNGR|nr:hypothetical protein CDL15_Pgr023733 [Punica granatum]